MGRTGDRTVRLVRRLSGRGSPETGVAEGEAGQTVGVPRAARVAAETLAVRIGALAIGLLASLILARLLGPIGRGEYVFPLFVVGIAAITGHLSYDFTNVHLFSTRAADAMRLSSLAFWISLGAGLVTMVVVIVAVIVIAPGDSQQTYLLIAAVGVPFMVQRHALDSILRVTGRVRTVNLADFTFALVHLGVILVLWGTGHLSVPSVIVATLATTILSWAIVGTRAVPRVSRPERSLAVRALKFSLRVHLASIIALLMWRGDVFFVNGFLSIRDVGLYTLAVFIAELPLFVADASTAVGTSAQVASEADDRAALSARLHRITVLAVTLTALLVGLLAPFAVPLLYGEEFADAVPSLLILLPGIAAFGSYRALGVYLLGGERQLRFLICTGTALVVNVAGNLLLIGEFGLVGVSAAATLSYVVMYALMAQWFLTASGASAVDLIPRRADAIELAGLVRAALRRTEPTRYVTPPTPRTSRRSE